MPSPADLQLLADYNQWMNQRLYACAAQLPPAELARERGAYFGSLLGTLNHVAVGDRVWLRRFAAHPARPAALQPVLALPTPARLDEILYPALPPLAAHRAWLDQRIVDWTAQLRPEDLACELAYTSLAGETARRPFGGLVLHFFNHQTHHRGQATTLLSQAGIDMGATDLVLRVPASGDAPA
ncbi:MULTISPECIES: DinB family protein [Bordetella]|uniref:DinB family protein n=1 Tax=Bordetella TaxID=517 RepID=UPI0004598F7F|nr:MULTISPECIES: DinB family protein [Bordetella]ARP77779.1 damage-inducible protein DinB [Bordetella genomosp. 6]KCV62214.1 DinB family protein [Bordetella bronchiseptica 99-R-0433]MBN3268650.1 damage-inducible protein DinB [Bordetella bronchiseptica]